MQQMPLWRRVLARLWQAVLCEVNPHYQADQRIAYLTVVLAQQPRVKQPHVVASYAVLGVHPERVWAQIQAQRRSLLGREYSRFYDPAGLWIAEPLEFPPECSSPRKPMQSVRLPPAGDDEAA